MLHSHWLDDLEDSRFPRLINCVCPFPLNTILTAGLRQFISLMASATPHKSLCIVNLLFRPLIHSNANTRTNPMPDSGLVPNFSPER